MARQKSVFASAEQAIHVWASRTQCGRNRCGNVFFDRASIWSYGNHFRMAQFVENARGDVACLVNTETYSRTTAHHLSMVRHSVPSYVTRFDAPGAAINHSETLEYFETESAKAWQKAKRARLEWRINSHIADAQYMVRQFNEYAAFFDISHRLEMPADIDTAIAQAKQRAETRSERERAAKAERECIAAIEAKKQARKDRATMRQWVAGADVRLPYSARDGDIRLRIRGDIIQTSHGAEVPIAVAPMLWEMIERAKQAKTAADYSEQDIRVGHFQLREIRENGDVRIGCHFLRYAELLRLADILGLTSQRIAA